MASWKIEWTDDAFKALHKLNKVTQARILKYLHKRLATEEDPRRFGQALRYHLGGLWRYRVEDYRIICHFEDAKLIVLVVDVDHRKDIYD